MGELLDKVDILCIGAKAGGELFMRQILAYSSPFRDSGSGSPPSQYDSDADQFVLRDCAYRL